MSKVKFRPIGGQILARFVDTAETVKGGIIIPEIAKDKPQEAEVIAVGSGQFEVKVGDRILASKHGGTEMRFNGVSHLILREKDILAIVTR